MAGPEVEKISLRMESIWTDAEKRIMEDVIRRIKQYKKITSTADYQINRLIELGKSTEEIEKIIKEALDATYPQMFELYDEVTNWQYVRNRDIYEQVNGVFIPPEENEWLKQVSDAVKKQTADELKNLSQSYGFTVMMGNKRVFTPFADYYQQYVDNAIMDIVSGGFDYNTVMRRVVTQMTNSGLRTVDYASGHSNRVPVAVRRAVLTGVSQITRQVNERNAALLDTDYYEVSWHAAARPDHRVWQGKVYSHKQLEDICGLGTVIGLCGANCRHDYYPFIPGISERLYTDEWLEEQNKKEAQTKEWMGKEYDAYGLTQKQRQMETAMRAQREKVDLLKAADVDKEEITIARCKYQAQLDEYSRFCRKMGLKEQRERIYIDMRGRVAPSKAQYQKYLADKATKNIAKTSDSGIINSGAISGARNPYGKAAREHAERYYGLVRSMKTDVSKIAKVTGYSESEIQRIKNYIFIDEHDLGNGKRRFDPDYMMGESWKRLIEGKPKEHDLTLLKHEIMENELISQGLSQDKAHIKTTAVYNYDKEANEYYGKIKKYKKE